MKTKLNLIIEDLDYNFTIYFIRLIKEYIKRNDILDLSEFLYYCMENFQLVHSNIFEFDAVEGQPIEGLAKFHRLLEVMRNRRYLWEEDNKKDKDTSIRLVTRDNSKLLKLIDVFIKKNDEKLKN